MAAAGTSIMAPNCTGPNRWSLACSSCRAWATWARVCKISCRWASIGNIKRTGPCAAARKMARSWVRNIAGSAKLQRIARKPKAGFKNTSRPCFSRGLSAPMSIERIVKGRPCIPSTACRYAWYCSSSSGSWPARPMNKNSLRNSPTPSAPASTAAAASAGCSILASSSITTPSRVMAGVWRKRAKRLRSKATWRWRKRYSSIIAGDGSTSTTPASPSTMSQSSWRISW